MATSEAPELIGLAQRTLRDLRLRVAGASGGGPDALAVIDIEGCWEAQLHGEGERGCHLTTGTLAGFLGCLADYPVAVMEIECSVGGTARCRFLAGNADMHEHAYDRVSRGEQWETIGAGEF